MVGLNLFICDLEILLFLTIWVKIIVARFTPQKIEATLDVFFKLSSSALVLLQTLATSLQDFSLA